MNRQKILIEETLAVITFCLYLIKILHFYSWLTVLFYQFSFINIIPIEFCVLYNCTLFKLKSVKAL